MGPRVRVERLLGGLLSVCDGVGEVWLTTAEAESVADALLAYVHDVDDWPDAQRSGAT